MAFWLIVSLGSTAGLFFLLHADFVAATQLLIYVGGTLVLLIFGVMLTASGPFVRIATSPAQLLLAGGVGVLLLGTVFFAVGGIDWRESANKVNPNPRSLEFAAGKLSEGYNPVGQGNTARPLGLKLLGLSLEDLGSERDKLSAGFLLPFEIASVHLLVVLVGAAYLARAKRRAERELL
jgi:NADH:ubiquinone oxidoreductase subunit 6 (subunit J)